MSGKDQSLRIEGRGKAHSVRRGADKVVARMLRAGAATYDRTRDLPKLIRLAPGAFEADAVEGAMILSRLERALRAERHRARSGHWTYDLNRHIALRQAYLADRDRLQASTKHAASTLSVSARS